MGIQILTKTPFDEPNEQVIIYKGSFTLKNGDIEIPVDGKIYYKWFPSQGVAFDGHTSDKTDLYSVYNYDLVLNSIVCGACFITNYRPAEEINIEGKFNSECYIGEKNISVTGIYFELFNFRDFAFIYASDGIILQNEKYLFEIVKHKEFKSEFKKLKALGGYQPLYSGKLYLIDNKGFTHTESDEILSCLFHLITFLNGRRTSPLFRKGVFEDEIIWSDYSSYYVDQFKHVKSWAPQFWPIEVQQMWVKLTVLWQDQDIKEVLQTAIMSYVRANGDSVYFWEGVTMTANTLELLFNFLIVEQKKIISGKDIENLQASNKIRLLLAQMNVLNDIPETLVDIIAYRNSQPHLHKYDGPELFTYIRNIMVHGQLDKRRKLSDITNEALRDIQTLGIWYVELIILYILNYEGKYSNRTLKAQYSGQDEEIVPWKIAP